MRNKDFVKVELKRQEEDKHLFHLALVQEIADPEILALFYLKNNAAICEKYGLKLTNQNIWSSREVMIGGVGDWEFFQSWSGRPPQAFVELVFADLTALKRIRSGTGELLAAIKSAIAQAEVIKQKYRDEYNALPWWRKIFEQEP